MPKKSYQKGLPTVLPPSPPAPRRSPESIASQTASPRVAAPPPRQPEVVRAPAPELDVADAPGRRLPRWLVALIGVVSLAAAGYFAFALIGDFTDESAPDAPVGADPIAPWLSVGESHVETEVLANGDVVAHHWIRAAEPIRRLRLTLPAVPGVANLSATEIKVTSDGQPVDGPDAMTDRRVIYTFVEADEVEVTYRLSGAVERSDSADGRALALATSLDVSYPHRVRSETRVVLAREVLALACTASADQPPVPCGQSSGEGRWRVELDGREISSRVVAQLTLE